MGKRDKENTGKTRVSSPWPREVRQQAKDLFGQGTSINDINEQLDIPIDTLKSWKYRYNWGDFKKQANTDAELEIFEDTISTLTESKRQLMKGYQLIAMAGEDGVLDDGLRFRHKKQAIDSLVVGLKGQVELRGSELTNEFLIDVAKIIRDEVIDVITLQRIGEKLVALGKLYNQRAIPS